MSKKAKKTKSGKAKRPKIYKPESKALVIQTAPKQAGDGRPEAGGAKVKKREKNTPQKLRTPASGLKSKLSGLDAAEKVLREAGEPLRAQTIVDRAVEKGYWQTNGKTPAATVYAAMLREIQTKGDAARFRKADRGLFTIAS